MLTACLIDDDDAFRLHLSELLTKDHPDIRVVSTYSDPEDALIALKAEAPDLVFLDVEMPGLTGMQLLEHFPQRTFDVVFTSSHDKYAFSAIKKEATDYLLKPVSRIDLAKAVEKVKANILAKKAKAVSATQSNPKIPLHSTEGIALIEVRNILRCEADNNYTTFFLADGKKIVATRGLADVEAQLTPHGFFRPHKSHLINLQYISKVMKTEGGSIVMSDGSHVPIARTKKDELMSLISGLS